MPNLVFSQVEYRGNINELLSFGFSSIQVSQLFLLSPLFLPLAIKLSTVSFQLSPAQILNIATQTDGFNKLKAIQTYCEDLIAYGYNIEDILDKISSDDGSKIISDIGEEINNVIFEGLHYTPLSSPISSRIRFFSSRFHSTLTTFPLFNKDALHCIENKRTQLLASDFSSKQADDLILKCQFDCLFVIKLLNHPYQLNHAQITKAAIQNDGFNKLETIQKYFEDLTAYGYSTDDIINRISCDNGSQILSAMGEEVTKVIFEGLPYLSLPRPASEKLKIVSSRYSSPLNTMLDISSKQTSSFRRFEDMNEELDNEAHASKRVRYV